jgi:DNA-binding transcriptional MerR regulator
VKAHTLRIWEQRYGLVSPKRTQTNIRFYDDDDLRLLLNVSLLNERGFRISELARMNHGQLQQLVQEQTLLKVDDYAAHLQALTVHMLELNERAFDKVINTSVLQIGLENCMLNVVFPFLHNVGVLWQTGAINPAHEHFISNIIRQKLIVAIDGQQYSYDDLSIVPKLYVDAVSQGLSPKGPVTAATTQDASGYIIGTYSPISPGSITSITEPLVGGNLIIDSIIIQDGSSVLINNQQWPQDTSGNEANGIYIWNKSNSSLTRRKDLQTGSDATGAFCSVKEGKVKVSTVFNVKRTIKNQAERTQVIKDAVASNTTGKAVTTEAITGSTEKKINAIANELIAIFGIDAEEIDTIKSIIKRNL